MILLSPEQRDRTQRYIARLDRARATLRDEVEADVSDYRGLTMEQRASLVVRLCAGARAILETRPDRTKVLAYQDPPAPDFADKWNTMRARYRAGRQRAR